MSEDEYLMIAVIEIGVRSYLAQERNCCRDEIVPVDCCCSNFRTRKVAVPVVCIKSMLKELQLSGELDVLEGQRDGYMY